MAFDVYGVGNALVDIQARVDERFLELIGFQKGIMTLVDEAAQRRVLEQLAGRPTNRCAGGSAANTVMGVADFGGTGAYAGKTGHDEIGEFFLADMRRMGVRIEVPPVAFDDLTSSNGVRENSETIRKRIMETRKIQGERFKQEGIFLNYQIFIVLHKSSFSIHHPKFS